MCEQSGVGHFVASMASLGEGHGDVLQLSGPMPSPRTTSPCQATHGVFLL